MNFKFAVVGNSGVGKTTLLRRVADKIGPLKATHVEQSTIGLDFRVLHYYIEGHGDITITVWDTAGQERFNTITAAYYRRAIAVILMYDVNDRESFQAISHLWMPAITADPHPDVRPKLFLIGNKDDDHTVASHAMSQAEVLDLAGSIKAAGTYAVSSHRDDLRDLNSIFYAMVQALCEDPKVIEHATMYNIPESASLSIDVRDRWAGADDGEDTCPC